MLTLNFNTKKEYLAWVKEWRTEYKALSEEIRNLKKQRKQFIWKYRPKDMTAMKRRTKVGPNLNYDSGANWRAAMKGETARRLMELRMESKILASEQMKETKKAA